MYVCVRERGGYSKQTLRQRRAEDGKIETEVMMVNTMMTKKTKAVIG